MKRFHVHITVKDLSSSIDFYSKLFGEVPSKERPDYAKWMLEDPRINFAISSRGEGTGVNHFGMQTDTDDELAGLKLRADEATQGAAWEQGEAACCYAHSEKHWIVDPQGLAWEHFHTLSDAGEFGEDTDIHTGPCCIPMHSSETEEGKADCCVPNSSAAGRSNCC